MGLIKPKTADSLLPDLESPAAPADILAGLAAYDDKGGLMVGTLEAAAAGLPQAVYYTPLFFGGNTCNEITGGWTITKANNTGNPAVRSTDIYLNAVRVTGSGTGTLIGTATAKTVNNIMLPAGCDFIFKPYMSYIYQAYLCASISGAEIWRKTGVAFSNWVVHNISEEKNGIVEFSSGNNRTDAFSPTISHVFVCYDDEWNGIKDIVDLSGSTMEEILANSADCAAMLDNKECVDFIVKKCTGKFMYNAVMSNTFISAMNASENKTLFTGNEHWIKFIELVA